MRNINTTYPLRDRLCRTTHFYTLILQNWIHKTMFLSFDGAKIEKDSGIFQILSLFLSNHIEYLQYLGKTIFKQKPNCCKEIL